MKRLEFASAWVLIACCSEAQVERGGQEYFV